MARSIARCTVGIRRVKDGWIIGGTLTLSGRQVECVWTSNGWGQNVHAAKLFPSETEALSNAQSVHPPQARPVVAESQIPITTGGAKTLEDQREIDQAKADDDALVWGCDAIRTETQSRRQKERRTREVGAKVLAGGMKGAQTTNHDPADSTVIREWIICYLKNHVAHSVTHARKKAAEHFKVSYRQVVRLTSGLSHPSAPKKSPKK